jgi:hypothetical protein
MQAALQSHEVHVKAHLSGNAWQRDDPLCLARAMLQLVHPINTVARTYVPAVILCIAMKTILGSCRCNIWGIGVN